MNSLERLKTLSSDMHLEADGEKECHPVIEGKQIPNIPITEVSMPGGRKMKVLKTMLTSACERNCNYCPFRAGRKMRRQSFKPEELATAFHNIYRVGAVEGMFLSSGIIKGGVTTQDKLIDTADILRNKLGYKGYMHLKIMPGAEKDQLRRAMQLASRVSINLESANKGRLPFLAPMKKFDEELFAPLRWAQEIRSNESPENTWNRRAWASTITQFVVGPSGESDLELLSTSEFLYHKLKLARTYYSAFIPVPDTPLDGLPPEDPIRVHRLYQSSFLLRNYGFDLEDMPFEQNGNLPLDRDPKTAWAMQHLVYQPVELNKASREQLLVVPGIGVQGAATILKARRYHHLNSLTDLKQLGIVTNRLKPYVLLNGRRQDFQMELFSPLPAISRKGPRARPGQNGRMSAQAASKPSSKKIQNTYLALTLFNTLATSFIWGINTLFLLDAGLSNAEAFLANAFFTVGQVIFEVPTGLVADLQGRRKSYLLGTITLAFSTGAYLAAWMVHAPLWAFAIASVLLGMGFTFFSGATEAWLVDALNFSDYQGEVDDVFAKGQSIMGIAMLTGSVAGGIIAQVTNLGVPYYLRAFFLLITFGIGYFYMRDWGFTPQRSVDLVGDVRKLFKTSIDLGLRQPKVRWVMLAAPFSGGVGIYAFYAMQPYLLELYGDETAYGIAGLAAAIVAGAQIVGGIIAPRLRKLFTRRTAALVTAAALSALMLVLIGMINTFWLAILFLFVWGLLFAASMPIRQAYLNNQIPSNQRATVLSFDAPMSSSGGVLFQPPLGRVADVASYAQSFLVGGVIQALAVPLLALAHLGNSVYSPPAEEEYLDELPGTPES